MLEQKLEYNKTVHQIFIDFKKAYDSGRKEVLYNTLTEFRIPMKVAGLIKQVSQWNLQQSPGRQELSDILLINTLRTRSFKLFKCPFSGFLTILTL